MTDGVNRRAFLGAAAFGLSSRPSFRRSVLPSTFRAPPDEFLRDLPRLLDLATTPGLSAAVLSGGRTIWAQGFGRTGTDGTAAVNADAVFEAASLSKPVFAYLVMLLVQDGVIDLDRPLDGYLGSPYVPGNELAAKITARHVLSHSTGYRNWRFNDTHTLAPDFAPGERWQYSGEGYYELQRAVETITGKDLTALARERVLGPLGMRRSSYVPLPEFDANRATGHRRGGVAITPPGPPPPTALPVMRTPNAAGSLRTTANDFARFLAVMTGAVEGPLQSRFRDGMTVRQITVRGSLSWGLGWGLETREGSTLIWHWGDNPGFKNFVIADPVAKEGIVVFTNGDGGRAVYERLVRASAGFDPAAFSWI
jgi:CubicO group peptidase (beta-lactamase class C family)